MTVVIFTQLLLIGSLILNLACFWFMAIQHRSLSKRVWVLDAQLTAQRSTQEIHLGLLRSLLAAGQEKNQ